MFVHPRTVDIDYAGDRLRRISTQLGTAAEKHINRLHWEPCLVTMAKHTEGRREDGGVSRGNGFRAQSLRICLSQRLLSFGHVCHFPSASAVKATASHSLSPHSHINTYFCLVSCIPVIDGDPITLATSHTLSHCPLLPFLFVLFPL